MQLGGFTYRFGTLCRPLSIIIAQTTAATASYTFGLSFGDSFGHLVVYARSPVPSASSGSDIDHGGAPLGHSPVPNGAPPVLPTAGSDDGVHLDSEGDTKTELHDKIAKSWAFKMSRYRLARHAQMNRVLLLTGGLISRSLRS